MLFKGINIRRALIRERILQHRLLQEAQDLLMSDFEKDNEIINRLKGSRNKNIDSIIVPDTENIFTLDQIKSVCIKYRLRFLDSSFFKQEYPHAAIAEVKSFEKKYGKKISSFNIMAPSALFNLENINKDPILFAQLSDNNYYLLHQWGNDLAWYRRIISWPFQSLKTLLITLILICAIFAFSLPSSIMNIFSFQSEIYLRLWLTIHTFIGLLGITLWLGLSFDKSFSGCNWNSKYYNG